MHQRRIVNEKCKKIAQNLKLHSQFTRKRFLQQAKIHVPQKLRLSQYKNKTDIKVDTKQPPKSPSCLLNLHLKSKSTSEFTKHIQY